MGKIINDHLATKTYLDGRLKDLRNDILSEINKMIDRKFTLHTTIISVILGLVIALLGICMSHLNTIIQRIAN